MLAGFLPQGNGVLFFLVSFAGALGSEEARTRTETYRERASEAPETVRSIPSNSIIYASREDGASIQVTLWAKMITVGQHCGCSLYL